MKRLSGSGRSLFPFTIQILRQAAMYAGLLSEIDDEGVIAGKYRGRTRNDWREEGARIDYINGSDVHALLINIAHHFI